MNPKNNVTFFLTIALFLNVPLAWCQTQSMSDSSTCQCSKEINGLNRRVDSLEARLESLQIQIVESNPFKSAKYLQWGKGITLSMTKSPYRITLEAGYTFLTPKSHRLGIFFGHDAEFGANCDFPHYGFYGKAAYGTPVFINFISLNGYFKTLYFPRDARFNFEQTNGAIGVGAELEFWFKPTLCYTFGGSMTAMHCRSSITFFKLNEINFIGLKYYPSFKKKK